MHQRPTRITLAGVFAAIAITRAEHLLVDDHIDAILPMPALAYSILNHRHIDSLQRLGTQTRAGIQCAPASSPAKLAKEILVLLGQTNGSCRGRERNINQSVMTAPINPQAYLCVA